VNGFSRAKVHIDALVLAELRKEADGRGDDAEEVRAPERWVFHDLRRTARTLMSRAGVDADIAERVVGHVIGGIRGVYDRHEFANEKRKALMDLAALIRHILDPPKGNVVPMQVR
jgi:integrase